MTDKRKHTIAIIAIGLFMLIGLFFTRESAYALSLSRNVSAECETNQVNKGDEVRININTKSMKISTFIASVEYSPELLEYIGYENNNGGDSVELIGSLDSNERLDISVEQSESKPIIGMYAIGTKERKYSEAKPLVTLIFTAKTDGAVQYKLSESTAGSDCYTSEDVEERTTSNAQSEEVGVDAGTTVDSHAARNNNVLFGTGSILLVVLVGCITFVILRKRKDKHNDK